MSEVYEGEARRRHSEVYALERERRGTLEEWLVSTTRLSSAISSFLLVAFALRTLSMVPEFSLFLREFWQVIILPPEEIARRYPALFYGSQLASNLLPMLHITLQFVAARRKGVEVWVPEGLLGAVNTALLYASIISLQLYALLSRDWFTILFLFVYAAMSAAYTSQTARNILKKVEGGGKGGGEA